MKICSSENCGKKVYALDMCRNCYARYYRNGHAGYYDPIYKIGKEINGAIIIKKSKVKCIKCGHERDIATKECPHCRLDNSFIGRHWEKEKWDNLTAEKLRLRFKEYLTLEKIAKRYGITKQAISYMLVNVNSTLIRRGYR